MDVDVGSDVTDVRHLSSLWLCACIQTQTHLVFFDVSVDGKKAFLFFRRVRVIAVVTEPLLHNLLPYFRVKERETQKEKEKVKKRESVCTSEIVCANVRLACACLRAFVCMKPRKDNVRETVHEREM